MTPLTFSIAGAVASVLLVLVVLELIRKRRLQGALRAALARDRHRAARALGLALGDGDDRRLVRRRDVSAGRAVRRRDVLHPLVLLDYSTAISKLVDQNVVLAQRLAILEEKLKDRDRE